MRNLKFYQIAIALTIQVQLFASGGEVGKMLSIQIKPGALAKETKAFTPSLPSKEDGQDHLNREADPSVIDLENKVKNIENPVSGFERNVTKNNWDGFEQICGFVLDNETLKPLPSAGIIVEETDAFHTSDSKGFFEIKNLKSGQTLRIEYQGYQSVRIPYNDLDLSKCQNFFISTKDKYLVRVKRRGIEKRKEADELFSKFAFSKAIPIYKDLVAADYDKIHALQRLAECYLFLRDFEKSIPYFNQFINKPQTPSSFYYKYAMALRSANDIKKSMFWLKQYEKRNKRDPRIKEFLQGGDSISVAFNSEARYALEPVHFNTKYSDFGGFYHDGNLYFSSSRIDESSEKLYDWNSEAWLDLYFLNPDDKKSVAQKVPGEINTKFHESSLVFSTDYKNDTIIYFTRNNFFDNQKGFTVLRKEDEIINLNNLKIYKAELKDGEWKVTRNLRTNADHYSSGHPSVNTDRSLLYFASNRPGGYGGTDIYYAQIHPRGGVFKPVNAGPIINTAGNEMFPFVNNEGQVFFSSDGHAGYGQLDVFGTVMDEEGNIQDVINLGKPLNSEKDDFAYYALENGIDGFVSSNRDGGQGSDDIYKFQFTPPLVLNGAVTDAINLKPLQGVTISLFDQATGDLVTSTETDSLGNYQMKLIRKKNYRIEAFRNTHPKKSIYFDTQTTPRETTVIIQDIQLEPILDVKLLAGLNKIYFDFDKSNIRRDAAIELDKVVKLLTVTYPSMVIRLESHTDPVGSHSYNDRLSQRRAKSTYKYLISKGVPKKQIVSYRGFGKRRLINGCKGRKDCTAAELELNRRTEFPIERMPRPATNVGK